MSERRIEQVKCPRCGYDSPMEVWGSINADLDPELKERFLNGDLFAWKCEVCGEEHDVVFDTLYHDMEHRFMLFFTPAPTAADKYESLEINLPGLGVEGYTFRKVYGFEAMREKISILEQGLSDVAVERLKYFARLDPENHLLPDDGLLFFAVDTDEEKMERSGWKRGAMIFARLREGTDPQPLAFPMEEYYNHLLTCNMDARMMAEVCICVDYGWIDNKLRGK